MRRAGLFTLALILTVVVLSAFPAAAAPVSAATGGDSISSDDVATGTYTALTGPVIGPESAVGEIGLGSIVLAAPAGFAFQTSSPVSVAISPPGQNAMKLSASSACTAQASIVSVTPSASTIAVYVCAVSTKKATLTFSGAAVSPTAGSPLASGDIANAGTAAGVPAAEFGTLTQVPGALADVTISSSSGTVQVDQSVTFTGTPRDQFGNARADVVSYAAAAGGTIDSSTGVFTAGTVAGTFSGAVTATAATVSASADVTIAPGDLASLAITPSTSSVAAGAGESYAVEGFDVYGNSRGDETSGATFAISPDGACTGASCSATVAGPHTVTASIGAVGVDASLGVVPAGLASMSFTSAPGSIIAGGTAGYALEGFDAFGNSRGDVTPDASLSISPDGSCTGASCTATVAGPHTVTAAIGAISASVGLDVTPGALASITLQASATTVNARPDAGSGSEITATASDAYGNALEGVAVSFAITGDASGAGVGDPLSPSLSPTSGATGADGTVSVSYTAGHLFGEDEITATSDTFSDTITIIVRPFVCGLAACPA